MFDIYWLISEDGEKTYVGYSDNLKRRIIQHRNRNTKSTTNFGNFKCFRLEKVSTLNEAKKREKYWKTSAGRKKLKIYFKDIRATALSSSG